MARIAGGLHIATVKYEPDGKPSPTWPDIGFGVGVRRFAGAGDGRDSGRKIALWTSSGNAYVFGQSGNGAPEQDRDGYDLVLIKYDFVGRQAWVRACPTGGSDLDAAADTGARRPRERLRHRQGARTEQCRGHCDVEVRR